MRILSPLAVAVALLCAAVPHAEAEEQPRGEWPLRPQPEVIERFDPPDSPYGAGHRGVDLLGHVGQTVHASLAGTVTFAGMLAGRGVVVVDHGDTRTTYEPVTASVSIGTPVAAGAPIGRLDLPMSHCIPRSCPPLSILRTNRSGRLSSVRELEPTTLRCRPVCVGRLTHLAGYCHEWPSDLGKHWPRV
jgi:peptidase M23-like protein